MSNVAYFGENFNQFKSLVNNLAYVYKSNLPPQPNTDILVMDGSPKKFVHVEKNIIGIVNSQNTEGLSFLMKNGIKTLTCGMSYRDTLTLSSSLSNLNICLQRKIPSLNNNILEPCEYVITNPHSNTDLLLLACAVNLLCGCEPI